MSTDEGNNVKPISRKPKKPPEPRVVAQLVVSAFDNGRVSVTGPLSNPIEFYGLLGIAFEFMVNRHRQQQDQQAAQEQVKGSLSWWRRIVKRFNT